MKIKIDKTTLEKLQQVNFFNLNINIEIKLDQLFITQEEFNKILQAITKTKPLAKKKISTDEIEYLRYRLLNCLRETVEPKIERVVPPKKPFQFFILILLALAGIIFSGCEGFDGITAILKIFSLSALVIIIVGVCFSFLSIIVFFAFNFVEISKNLGVGFNKTFKTIDSYIDQIAQIRIIELAFRDKYGQMNSSELKITLNTICIFEQQIIALQETFKNLNQGFNKPWLKFLKFFTALTAGIIFFSGGFFAGQAVSIAIAGLFVAAVSPTFWPVILASALVGVAAFSVYWFVEKPQIEKLVGKLLGYDQNKISALCNPDYFALDIRNLKSLATNLTNQLQNKTKINLLSFNLLSLPPTHYPSPLKNKPLGNQRPRSLSISF